MTKRSSLLALWVCWLALELEVLLVANYPIRTELRALFGLPLYHVLLTFLALAVMVRWLESGRVSQWKFTRYRPVWMLSHFLFYLGLVKGLQTLWDFSQRLPSVLSVSLWGGVIAVYLVSWLLAWLPFHQWGAYFKAQAVWLWWVLPLSLLVPYLAEEASFLWWSFADATFKFTYQILLLLYDDAICDQEQLMLGTSIFSIEILPGCSGYEGMGLIATLTAAYLWLKRDQLLFPFAFLLVPLGVTLAYVGNLLRLVALVIIGTEISPSIALRGFHSQAGWISFTVLGLATIGAVESCGWFHRPNQRSSPEAYVYPALPYLMPQAGLLFATMLVQGTTGLFPYSYPLKPLVGAYLLFRYADHLRSLWHKPGWEALGIGIGVYFLWMALARPTDAVSPYEALSQPFLTLWLAARVIGGVLVVPIVEELAFRGYLLRRLQSADFEAVQGPPPWYAYLGSSLAFGLMHTDWLAGLLAGLAYAWVSTRKGGLSNAILAHSMTNLGLAIRAVAWQEWGLW